MKKGTRGGDLPPNGMPRRRYRMVVDRLREATGRDTGEVALELKSDVGEGDRWPRGREEGEGRRRAREDPERLQWAVRWGVLGGMVDDLWSRS